VDAAGAPDSYRQPPPKLRIIQKNAITTATSSMISVNRIGIPAFPSIEPY
jgi:hypothetical protein